jgi:hypothetical protein
MAASVDLRCYSLATPRHDGKLSVLFPDLNYSGEWEIDELPWDAVTPIGPGKEHPEHLDAALVEAITKHVAIDAADHKSKGATLAFLYLYLTLAHGNKRC